jgi:hypothetical protein
MHHKGTSDDASITQYTVLMALHHGLTQLELQIVWIEWIANWKNRMKLLYAKHSPLQWIHNPGIKIKCFDKLQIDGLFRIGGKTFASVKQLLPYIAQSMFGCRIVKNQEGKWIMDQPPLDPTHELNLELTEKHHHFDFAKEIDKSKFNVMKCGRLWQRKESNEQSDDFLTPELEFEHRKYLKWGSNAQFLMLLKYEQYLVQLTPEIEDIILPWQKVKDYYIEIDIPPRWNREKRRMETYRIEKRQFVHVGVNLEIVTKQIWFTRDVWFQKLLDIQKVILMHKNNPDITIMLQEEGCDENYSDNPEIPLSDRFDILEDHIKWIEHCTHTNLWTHNDGGHKDHTALAQRLARIVYQIFSVHTIWTVVEEDLLETADRVANKIQPVLWDTKKLDAV